MSAAPKKNRETETSKSKESEVQVNPITSTSSGDGKEGGDGASDTSVPPPPPDTDLFTQTDKDGNSLSSVSPQMLKTESEISSSNNTLRLPWWQVVFCCLRPKRAMKVKQRSVTQQMQITHQPSGRKSISGHTKLLKPLAPEHKGKKCLALDLDETLVHSSFEKVDKADFVIPVVIDNVTHHVYVLKRPGVDEFMQRMGKIYEIVVYTASLSKYADPLLDKLDIHNVISARLFREHCVYFQGHYVKDMSLLNRPVHECIIVDNSPMSYAFHPENAIGCGSYIDSPRDVEMWQIADFLEHINKYDDIRGKTRSWRQWCSKNQSSVPDKENI